jgi:hypothetical protein
MQTSGASRREIATLRLDVISSRWLAMTFSQMTLLAAFEN